MCMGFAPTWLHQVSPPPSQNHFNHWLVGTRMHRGIWLNLTPGYKTCKAPVKSSPPTNQHPTFYRPDVLPVAQPTVSEHSRDWTNSPLCETVNTSKSWLLPLAQCCQLRRRFQTSNDVAALSACVYNVTVNQYKLTDVYICHQFHKTTSNNGPYSDKSKQSYYSQLTLSLLQQQLSAELVWYGMV